jgi:hypothetical protein
MGRPSAGCRGPEGATGRSHYPPGSISRSRTLPALGLADRGAYAGRSTLLGGGPPWPTLQLGVTLGRPRSRRSTEQAPRTSSCVSRDLRSTRPSGPALLDAAYGLAEPRCRGRRQPHPATSASCGALPKLLLARPPGSHMEGLLPFWHGDLDRDRVPALGFNGRSTRRRHGLSATALPPSPRPGTSRRTSSPNSTCACHVRTPRVAHLRPSRVHQLLFVCPRGHKGSWSGSGHPAAAVGYWDICGQVFDRHRNLPHRDDLV